MTTAAPPRRGRSREPYSITEPERKFLSQTLRVAGEALKSDAQRAREGALGGTRLNFERAAAQFENDAMQAEGWAERIDRASAMTITD